MGRQVRMANAGNLGRSAQLILVFGFMSSIVVGPLGCTRSFFRKKADKEVAEVLAEKDRYPAWGIEHFHVYPDPRARFADPTNPDRPPMPPDDPAAWELSPHSQKPGKAGVSRVGGNGYLKLLAAWDAENRAGKSPARGSAGGQSSATGSYSSPAQTQPPPEAASPVPSPAAAVAEGCNVDEVRLDPRRPFLIKLDQAVELGLINSREYQDQREDLYQAALPVTFQRFSFAAMPNVIENISHLWAGRDASFSGNKENTTTFDSTASLSKRFATGALLLARFANQTVINLGNSTGRDFSTQSRLSLDLTQPFLQGGGRAVTLEPLTQAERRLVYQIRRFGRFRKEYYVDVATGGGTSSEQADLLSALGGAGGFGGGATTVTANRGYLPVVQRQARLAIDQGNVAMVARFLKLYQALLEGGDVSQINVDNIEQRLLQSRSTVLQDQQDYQSALDRFKIQMGLPTETPLELDDEPLRPMLEQFARLEAVINEYEDLQGQAGKLETLPDVTQVRPRIRDLFTNSRMVQGTRFRTEILAQWREWEQLKEPDKRLRDYAAERRQLLMRRSELDRTNQQLSKQEADRLEFLDYQIDLGNFEVSIRAFISQPWLRENDPVRRQRLQEGLFREALGAIMVVLGAARNERLQTARQQWPEFPRVCLDGVDLIAADLEETQSLVARTALVNRWDLMNTRAQLVDVWRQVAVRANGLLGAVDLRYGMNLTSPAGEAKPFALGGSRSSHELGLNLELPLVRKAERNNYRTALIELQSARRALMAREDNLVQSLRVTIRQLRLQHETYKLQKRATELAYLNVESALETFRQPPMPTGLTVGGGPTAGNAAALTQQLLQSQQQLQFAQNQTLSLWVNILITRMQLYRDLELMALDSRGVWTDDIATTECTPCNLERSAGPGSGDERAGGERLSATPVNTPAAGAEVEPGR